MPNAYILADVKKDFINEVQNTLMLEDYPVQIFPVKTIDMLYQESQKYPDVTIIVSSDLVLDNRFSLSDYPGRKLTGFARNISEAETLKEHGIGCIGITKRADKFLEALSLPELPSMYKLENRQNVVSAPKQPITSASQSFIPVQPVPSATQPIPQSIPQPQPQAQQPAPQAQPAQQQMPMMGGQFTPEQMQMMMQMMQMMGQMPPQPITQQPVIQQARPQQQAETRPVAETLPSDQTGGETLMGKAKRRQNSEVDRMLEAELHDPRDNLPEKAVITTVYAAKGGVGKTTIATETAVFLALTNNGRRRLKVCIVDFNIDFGDVCSHLELDPRGNNMTTWAAEIQEQLDSGKTHSEINYSGNEILNNYLQKMEQTGLYALIAPINHEDSMRISADALKVMLRNISENCGFDFVICDTGNNTRDAAIISLDMANNILLIATQDITTANCDSAVLKVMKKTGLDTDKVRLIINNIIPAREAGISVSEVAETFHFECVAQIRRTPDIIKANNFGKPLVYKEGHEFTKQIQNIVRFLTSGVLPENMGQEKPKKKLLGIFNKK